MQRVNFRMAYNNPNPSPEPMVQRPGALLAPGLAIGQPAARAALLAWRLHARRARHRRRIGHHQRHGGVMRLHAGQVVKTN